MAVELNERKRHIESMTRVLALQHHIKQCRWEEIPVRQNLHVLVEAVSCLTSVPRRVTRL